jgi:nucleoside-diphosphate-sugar epimerase
VLELCNAGLEPEYREDQRAVRSASVARLAFDPAKAKRLLGWAPKVSIKEGIRRYIDWRKSLPGGG